MGITKMCTNENLDNLLDMVETCAGLKQRADYHPEIDLLSHLLQAYYHAIRESNDFELILAALLHDVGKVVDSYGHDKIGAKMIEPYVPHKTYWLVKQHMRFWTWIDGEMHKLSKVKELTDHQWLGNLALLARWDKAGRSPNKKPIYDREKILSQLKKIRDT